MLFWNLLVIVIFLSVIFIATEAQTIDNLDERSVKRVDISPGSSKPGCELVKKCFTPSEITVEIRQPVYIINQDSTMHTVTSGNMTNEFVTMRDERLRPDMPETISAGMTFHSGYLKPGWIFSFALTTEGVYDYFCAIHPWMTGKIIVDSKPFHGDEFSYKLNDQKIFGGITGGSVTFNNWPHMGSPFTYSFNVQDAQDDGLLTLFLPRKILDSVDDVNRDYPFVVKGDIPADPDNEWGGTETINLEFEEITYNEEIRNKMFLEYFINSTESQFDEKFGYRILKIHLTENLNGIIISGTRGIPPTPFIKSESISPHRAILSIGEYGEREGITYKLEVREGYDRYQVRADLDFADNFRSIGDNVEFSKNDRYYDEYDKSYVVDNLSSGKYYVFKLTATNEFGAGFPSYSEPIKMPLDEFQSFWADVFGIKPEELGIGFDSRNPLTHTILNEALVGASPYIIEASLPIIPIPIAVVSYLVIRKRRLKQRLKIIRDLKED